MDLAAPWGPKDPHPSEGWGAVGRSRVSTDVASRQPPCAPAVSPRWSLPRFHPLPSHSRNSGHCVSLERRELLCIHTRFC